MNGPTTYRLSASMRLNSQLEYETTCEKLSELQRLRKEAQERQPQNPHVKELTLASLNRLIKQLQEEKIWYECHTGIRHLRGPAVTSTTNTGGTSTPCTN